jgi:hypothetical protein
MYSWELSLPTLKYTVVPYLNIKPLTETFILLPDPQYTVVSYIPVPVPYLAGKSFVSNETYLIPLLSYVKKSIILNSRKSTGN